MKLYTLGRGGFADMYRKSLGQRFDLRRYPAHEIRRAARPAEALGLYRGEWRPGDVIFEIADPAHGAPLRDGAPAARAFTIIREVPDAELFGDHAARAMRVTAGLSESGYAAIGEVMQAWRSLPEGMDHCTCEDGEICEHEPLPGSRYALAEYGYPMRDDLPANVIAGCSLLSDWAKPIAGDYAAALWWYEAGRQSLAVGHHNCYWQFPGQPVLPGMGSAHRWRDEVRQCFASLIGAALCWQLLAAEDRQAWESVAGHLGGGGV